MKRPVLNLRARLFLVAYLLLTFFLGARCLLQYGRLATGRDAVEGLNQAVRTAALRWHQECVLRDPESLHLLALAREAETPGLPEPDGVVIHPLVYEGKRPSARERLRRAADSFNSVTVAMAARAALHSGCLGSAQRYLLEHAPEFTRVAVSAPLPPGDPDALSPATVAALKGWTEPTSVGETDWRTYTEILDSAGLCRGLQ